MKLNRRVWWLIVPVLLFSYTLVFSAIYYFEKNTYFKQEHARLQLQLSQLASVFGRYDNFIDVYYSSLIGSSALRDVLIEKNDRVRAFSIERNLSLILSDLNNMKFNHLNLAIIDGNGITKYFYVGGENPFSKPSNRIPAIVADMFANKQATLKKVLHENNKTEIIQARIINPLTMRRPLSGAWQEGAVAVILMFELTSFDQQRQLLKEKMGYDVMLSHEQDLTGIHKDEHSVHGDEHFSNLLWAHMDYDEGRIDHVLKMLIYQMLLGAVVLMVFSSLLLVLLIERYITRPILDLEQRIVAMNDKGGDFPVVDDAHDEISALQRAFAKLYSQLKASYELSQVQAQTDSLTKLHNRRMFNESVDGLIRRAHKDSHIALI